MTPKRTTRKRTCKDKGQPPIKGEATPEGAATLQGPSQAKGQPPIKGPSQVKGRSQAKGKPQPRLPFPVEKPATHRPTAPRPGKPPARPTPPDDGVRPEHGTSEGTRRRALAAFDLDATYGPCMGLTRRRRYDRAVRLGLQPPAWVGRCVAAAEADRRLDESVLECYGVSYRPPPAPR